ncbi:hypothetical protein ScPMuIL_009775 [Solemya velum]
MAFVGSSYFNSAVSIPRSSVRNGITGSAGRRHYNRRFECRSISAFNLAPQGNTYSNARSTSRPSRVPIQSQKSATNSQQVSWRKFIADSHYDQRRDLVAMKYKLYVVICMDISVAVAQNPCQDHRVLDGSSRLPSITMNQNHECDQHLEEGWYRIQVNNRSAEIPTKCIKNFACGTKMPLRIDLEGQSMPPHAGETIEASLCSSFDILGKWDCCVLRRRTQIQNCGEFYIYYLFPVDRCPVAYCAKGKSEFVPVITLRGECLGIE